MSADPLATLRAYAFELAGMSKTALQFVENDYDRDRFQRTLRIAESIASMTFPDGMPQGVEYVDELGIVTPKAGCSVAAFDAAGRLLLIRRADDGRWGLPGGYAEIGSPPSRNALRELHEETGYDAEIERLLGVFDGWALGSTHPYQHWTLLFRARITGGAPRTSIETTEVRLFAPDEVPSELPRVTRAMVAHALGASDEPAYQ
ncbi:MAG TPA: NUDIX domain-containing protein [Candidatus Dormibacteraeota bacterium]|jgi:ADP-ribose pyrophosphatase YjhB (NUDIX family)|nr:NUDIX domain-containing protein [Candidatus Dormibacteraeota bacterium]